MENRTTSEFVRWMLEREKGIEPSPIAWEAKSILTQTVGTAALNFPSEALKWKMRGKWKMNGREFPR